MKYFSAPADFKKETIDRYAALNDRYEDSRVVETYGQLTVGKMVYSGRATPMISEVNYATLEDYVGYSRERGLDFNYTLNPACMGNYEFSRQGIKELKALLRNLYNIGIESLTITTPSLFELARASGIKFKIKASAICEITTPDKTLFYQGLGAERIVVDPDVTRDFVNLERICRVFDGDVELIVNNVCYKHCAYKMFHYNHEAHWVSPDDTRTIRDYYLNRCAMQKAGDLKNVIRLNWVRPEDLKYYLEVGVKFFKIQGRQNVEKGDAVRTMEAYMKEDFDGNLYDLITIFAPYTAFQPYIDNKKLDGFVKKFYDDPTFCKNICSACGYCAGFAGKSMNLKEAEEMNAQALLYFNETDSYTMAVKSGDREKPGEEILPEGDQQFDFE